MTTTETMRASVMTGPGSLVIEERPVPVPGPNQVLIEVAAVGVCGSDVHYYRHGRIGDFVLGPFLLIPECIRDYGFVDDGTLVTDFDLIEKDEGRWYPDMWRDAWK